MSGDTRSYALEVSEHLFHLATEALRLFSNQTRQFQTLVSLVSLRGTAGCSNDTLNPETIRKHLDTIPSRGDILVDLNISKTSADSLTEFQERLSRQLGPAMTLEDAISVVLFDYIVEQKAARVLARIDLNDSSAGAETGASAADRAS